MSSNQTLALYLGQVIRSYNRFDSIEVELNNFQSSALSARDARRDFAISLSRYRSLTKQVQVACEGLIASKRTTLPPELAAIEATRWFYYRQIEQIGHRLHSQMLDVSTAPEDATPPPPFEEIAFLIALAEGLKQVANVLDSAAILVDSVANLVHEINAAAINGSVRDMAAGLVRIEALIEGMQNEIKQFPVVVDAVTNLVLHRRDLRDASVLAGQLRARIVAGESLEIDIAQNFDLELNQLEAVVNRTMGPGLPISPMTLMLYGTWASLFVLFQEYKRTKPELAKYAKPLSSHPLHEEAKKWYDGAKQFLEDAESNLLQALNNRPGPVHGLVCCYECNESERSYTVRTSGTILYTELGLDMAYKGRYSFFTVDGQIKYYSRTLSRTDPMLTMTGESWDGEETEVLESDDELRSWFNKTHGADIKAHHTEYSVLLRHTDLLQEIYKSLQESSLIS